MPWGKKEKSSERKCQKTKLKIPRKSYQKGAYFVDENLSSITSVARKCSKGNPMALGKGDIFQPSWQVGSESAYKKTSNRNECRLPNLKQKVLLKILKKMVLCSGFL